MWTQKYVLPFSFNSEQKERKKKKETAHQIFITLKTFALSQNGFVWLKNLLKNIANEWLHMYALIISERERMRNTAR